MSNVKDLTVITNDDIEIKFSEDNVFKIPRDPSLRFAYKLVDFEEKARKAKSNKQQFDAMVDMVYSILSQDKSMDIDREFIIDNLHFSQIQGVIQIYQDNMGANQNNPN